MWTDGVPNRWDPSRSHSGLTKLEIWSMSQKIAETMDFIDGSVTEKRVTGVRATMSLTVQPTRQWLEWLDLPGLEILPFCGASYGPDGFTIPMGVFPVLGQNLSAPVKAISIEAQDHWQYVQSADFAYKPMTSYSGLTRDVVAILSSELGIGADRVHPVTKELVRVPLNTASNDSILPSTQWDSSRHDTAVELAQSIGAETFINRYGQPEVRDLTTLPGRDLHDGEGGTVISATSTVSWGDVRNAITAISSNRDATVPPVTVMITDPSHPAYVSRIGPRTGEITSPLFTSEDQARQAALAELAKRSAPALSWTVECIPDPTRMPGDEFTFSTEILGTVRVVVQEVTHPFGNGSQSVKLGAPL